MMIANGISGLRLVILLVCVIPCIAADMKWSSWSRYSQCSVTCGKGRQRRQRQCVKSTSKSTGACSGPKEMYAPCQMLACPVDKVLPCNCGCTLRRSSGQIISQLPSRVTKTCEWKIVVNKGSKISLNVTRLILKAGWVRVASGKRALLTLLKPGPEPRSSYPWHYKSDGNVMTLELLSYPDATGQSFLNTYLAAEYREIKATPKRGIQETATDVHKNKSSKSPDVTAIIGITACVVVIILVAVFLLVRKHRKNNESAEAEDGNEAVTFHSEYDGKPRTSIGKEEKPLMNENSDRYAASQHSMIMRPNIIQSRDSAYESEKCLQAHPGNGLMRPRYPPDYYMKTPTYIHDPNFIRMIPVTSTGSMQPMMQPIVMHSPKADS